MDGRRRSSTPNLQTEAGSTQPPSGCWHLLRKGNTIFKEQSPSRYVFICSDISSTCFTCPGVMLWSLPISQGAFEGVSPRLGLCGQGEFICSTGLQSPSFWPIWAPVDILLSRVHLNIQKSETGTFGKVCHPKTNNLMKESWYCRIELYLIFSVSSLCLKWIS